MDLIPLKISFSSAFHGVVCFCHFDDTFPFLRGEHCEFLNSSLREEKKKKFPSLVTGDFCNLIGSALSRQCIE